MTHVHYDDCELCNGTGRHDGCKCSECDGTGRGAPIDNNVVPDEFYEGDETATYEATFRLMQESGVQGPRQTMQVESEQHAKELAVAWSEGELGHPWDVCTIEIPDLDYIAEIRL